MNIPTFAFLDFFIFELFHRLVYYIKEFPFAQCTLVQFFILSCNKSPKTTVKMPFITNVTLRCLWQRLTLPIMKAYLKGGIDDAKRKY